MGITMNAREMVLDMLLEILEKDKHSHVVLNRTLNTAETLDKKERSFISRLLQGTIEYKIALDYDLERFSKLKVIKMKPIIRNILRMSLYQIKYMDYIPDSAACNEAVELVKKKGLKNLSGFVNGILRNVIRSKEILFCYDAIKQGNEKLSIQYSIPLWIVDYLLEQYDVDKVDKILASFLQEKITSIRVNTSKISKEEVIHLLKEEGVTVTEGSYYNSALKIKDYDSIERLPSFQKGYYQIQDESSMLVGLIAAVKAGDKIIDVCAAPGGKSLHLSELLTCAESVSVSIDVSENEKVRGSVEARDLTEKKVALIKENISRVKANNISARVMDALQYDETSKETADIVIADLPCSGLGIIGKKPDIKYKMSKQQQQELVELQRKILDNITSYVKKGGILIYSTCTINKEENEENVKYLLREYSFELESLDDYLPKVLHSDTTKEGYLQLLPGIYESDGFFLARLRKV